MNQYKFNRFDVEKVKDDDHETSSSKCYLQVLVFLPLIFALLVIIFFSVVIGLRRAQDPVKFESATNSLGYMSKLQLENPIEGVQKISIANNCPTDYTLEAIGKYWGTNDGCLCEDGSTRSRALCMFSSQCKLVDHNDAIPYNNWKDFKFCVKRYASGQWYVQASCNSGHKSCPNNMCLTLTSLTCPITDINSFSSFTTATDGASGAQPIIYFDAAQTTELPCIDYPFEDDRLGKLPKKQSQKDYPFERVRQSGCGDWTNMIRAKQIDTNVKDTFQTQNALKVTFDSLPYYQSKYTATGDDYRLAQLQRPITKLDSKCKQFSSNQIRELNDVTDLLDNATLGFGITCLVLACIIFIMSILIIALKHNEGFFGSSRALIIVHVLAIILALLLISFGIYSMVLQHRYNMNASYDNFNKSVNNDCFDTRYKRPATFVRDYLKKSYKVIVPLLITLFVLAIVYLLVVLVSFILRKGFGVEPCNPSLL